ncbi:5'-methylthioadenosine/S-adenosylhomocysteine nucleosidase [Aliihoeflea aestuarii]|jgi:adenosylhomocysteine nucleosidase|uniref:5'-methylthioadenosine/S-adenosylhomocysteine nucleosidase n=1 Tax=Aliihoeflea aestuarii TaxID=453840 RepID=UPI0020948085|nr:5'-methylthioadenosine/S-adenosylhomocysteine nucleosidase [Aliihoeflea aestuarii]MCO6392039.1 5'-methylthioadenosine/S-adenosylhomocysteine nucleosidase [Aliihoeflea aestuarii]
MIGTPISEKLVGDHRILFLMAAPAEYGAHLKRLFTPLIVGVGPVEAAVGTASALARLAANGRAPHIVVSLGSAGSRTLDHAAVYQASSVSYRDMDASVLGFAKGITPYLDLPAEIALPLAVPGIASARLSTGAKFVSGTAYDAIDADMVDMETFAILRACQSFDVPLVALRGISDGRSELTGLSDWTDYLDIVDERLAEAIEKLEAAIIGGLLTP